jgi:MGT family glycosyltransferase
MSKLLFLNVPFAGHIYPTLGLVRELINRGHEVGYICSKEWEEEIISVHADFIPYINYNYQKGTIAASTRFYFAAYCTGLMYGREYDAILYEEDFFLGKSLAKQLNIPEVRIFSCIAYNEEVKKKFAKAGIIKKRKFMKNKLNRWITNYLAPGIERKENDRITESARNIAGLNLTFTSKEFQPYLEELDERFQFIGASIYLRNFHSLDIKLEETQEPIIYISLGTIFLEKISFYRKCIKAFLNRNVQVYFVINKSIDTSKLGAIPPNIHIYDFLPQLEVLKRASLFITHGGMNSINEAIYYKVPMLVIPQGADQLINASRVEELNIGRWIKNPKLHAKEFYDICSSIMKDITIAKKLKQMKGFNDASGGNQRGAQLIEEYLGNETMKAWKGR